MPQDIHSLRMRSSYAGAHLSGAERLLGFDQLEEAARAMLQRALNHPRGTADRIHLSLEALSCAPLRREPLLPLSTLEVEDWRQGRALAVELLSGLGLKCSMITTLMAQLAAGPAPTGGVMRGAMLVDSTSGERLEADPSRGLRVSRMDLDPAGTGEVDHYLAERGLGGSRITEAWTLASKVALYPAVLAELCWSDDPDYVTGYVASAEYGYQRITHLKPRGSRIGGRIFFLRPDSDLASLSSALQREPVLFNAPHGERG